MPGFFALSTDSHKYKDSFIDDLFWQTFYQQHLGESYAGLATYGSDSKINIRTHRGLFRPNFGGDMVGLEGDLGIGYCGDYREPILVDSKSGEFAACFLGNVINRDDLIEGFKNKGHSFAWGGIDIEILAKIIAQGEGFVAGIQKLNQEIRGAYSLSVLTPEGIYIICDPSGRWPIVLGEKRGAVAATTDPCGFGNWQLRGKIRKHMKFLLVQ